MTTILIILATAGIALLWRTYRYDADNQFNRIIDGWPFWIRKPLTCGLCFTFWVALGACILFSPFAELTTALPYRFALDARVMSLMTFLIQWLALGTLAAAAVYLIDTLFQISHYYKHAAHHE